MPRTYYVSQRDGSDADHGLAPKWAFKTLHKALAVAPEDSTIEVLNGTFSAQHVRTEGLTIDGNGVATIDARGKPYALLITGDDVTLRGWDVTGSSGPGVHARDVQGVTIGGNRAHHNDGPGIYTWQSSEVRVWNNEADHNGGAKASAGISIHVPKNHGTEADASFDIVLIDNQVHDNRMTGRGTEGWGIILDGVRSGHNPAGRWVDTYDGTTLVRGNVSHDNGRGGFLSHFAADVDFDDNFAFRNGEDAARGFEFGARGSRGIDFTGNVAAAEHAHFTFYAWEGTTGIFRGNWAAVHGSDDPRVTTTPAMPLAPEWNHWGEIPQVHAQELDW